MRLMGAPMGVVTEAHAVHAIIAAAEAGEGHWTITANLDHLRRYHSGPRRAEFDRRSRPGGRRWDAADLGSRLAGEPLPERVSGSRMAWSICEIAAVQGQSVFLLGGDPSVAERAASIFQARYPGLEIAGTACPRLGFENDPHELERIRREVTAAAPRIVFVALGFPKQDLLIRALRGSVPHASFLGVGISLSYVTGDVPRAPDWICELGLEWAYRLSREPTPRLARRYLVDGMPFGVRLMASAARHRARRGRPNASATWDS